MTELKTEAEHDREIGEIDLLSPLTIRSVTLRHRDGRISPVDVGIWR